MERLMSDLLASARGEQQKNQIHYNNYHHADGFIADESRFEAEQLNTNDNSTTPDITYRELDCSISSPETTSHSSPSYIRFYSPTGYSSSPTYTRGDYYDISPSSSPNSATATSDLSFSINSILGLARREHDAQPTTPHTPAVVSSSISPPSFYDWSSFQRMRVRDTTLPSIHWCHVCQTFCSGLTDVRDHNARHSLNREPVSLKRSFFMKHGYVTPHVQTDFLKRIKCGLCDRIVTKCFFSKHLRCHETLQCRVCRIECATQTRLDDHMNIHLGNQPFTCRTCGAKFSDRRKLANHMRQHKTSAVSCSYCEKTFKTRYTCDVHERIHTGYKPFPCTVPGCKKAFPQKIQLRLHLRIHGNYVGQ